MKRIATVLILALSVPLAAQAQDRARTEGLARRAAERLQALHQEAARLASEERTILGDLRRLEVERQIAAEQVKRTSADAKAAAAELTALDDQVHRLAEQERAASPALGARLVELYKLGQGRYLRLMLSMADARRLGQASRLVATVAKRDRDQMSAHQRRLEELTSSRRALQERSTLLEALRAEAERARAAADRAVRERNAFVAEIDRQRDLTAQLAGELQTAQQGLQARLRALVAQGSSPAPSPLVAQGLSSALPSRAALPLRPFRGDLQWPVDGRVRHRFGSTSAGARGPLPGIEIEAPEGAVVAAIHEGTVAFADIFAGYGRLVIVDHGAQAFSVYGNLLEIATERGAHLDGGERIGSVGYPVAGTAGLYFELRIDARPVDPLQWLKKR